MVTDEQLMLNARDGDLGAFETLVERHQQRAWGIAYRLLNDPAEAEDMAQQAFLKIFEAADRYQPTASFTTYLYRVVTRLCYDWIEKNKPIHVDPCDTPPRSSGESGPADNLVDEEMHRQVHQALSKLPERQRIAIELQQFDDLSYREIAEVMDTSSKAVERLIARARGELREQLEIPALAEVKPDGM